MNPLIISAMPRSIKGCFSSRVNTRLARTLREINISFRMLRALAMSMGLSTFLPVRFSRVVSSNFPTMETMVTQIAMVEGVSITVARISAWMVDQAS